jgi:hypothetical protein
MKKPFRPRFNRIYSGEWPYSSRECVGIRMVLGNHFDEKEFRGVLNAFECPEFLHNAMVDDMRREGFRECTVRAHIDFNILAIRLRNAGVTLSIIPPMPGHCKEKPLPEET